MKTTTQAQVPQTEMEVIYVTAAGKRHLLVQPEGDTVRIGENTHTVPAEAITWNAGKGRKGPVCIIREGVTQAVPIHDLDREGPGPREFDNAAHTDLLRQLNSLARDNQKPPTPWMLIIAIGIVGIIGIGSYFAMNGALTDLKHSVADLQAKNTGLPSDVTYCTTPPCTTTHTTTTSTPGLNGVPDSPGGTVPPR